MTRKLYVKRITMKQLAIGFETTESAIARIAGGYYEPVYVRCDKKGKVNFNTTAQYSVKELIEKNNVVIID